MNKTFLETIKIVDSEIYNLEYHQKRYESVLKSLEADNVQKLEEFINPPKWGIYRCRLVYDAENIDVTFHEYKKREISTLKLVFENDIEYNHKSTAREKIDTLFEKREECDDILIIKDLFITDTSIANIAFETAAGQWITPKSPLLKGTTRARLLDEGKLVEVDIKANELRTFKRVALLNAMIDFDILDGCEFLI